MKTEREFYVHGIPATKGSTRSFYNPKAKKKNGKRGRVVTIADNDERQDAWVSNVAVAAKNAGLTYVVGTPVSVRIIYHLPRPKAHYRTGKHAGELKLAAPEYCTKKPDVDKLDRAILDALTGIVYLDDAQVIEVHGIKRYTNATPGARVHVTYHG